MAGTQRQATKLATLLGLAEKSNLVPHLEEDMVGKIGRDVVKYTKLDDASRKQWLEKSKIAMELALQTIEAKSTPWPGASNIKFPLVTTASLQFHARAYPAVVPGVNVVKGQITGKDDGSKLERAKRIAMHMNWQLLEQDEEWEEGTDKLLLALAVEGCEFRKSYFSAEKGHNVSEWIRPEKLIVDNYTKSLLTCPRITQAISYYPHEIDTKIRGEVWSDVELNISEDERDEEKLQEFYEQHTFLDLDGDGYKEPYIVTVHEASEKVVRIVAGFFVSDIEVMFQGKRGRLGELTQGMAIQDLPPDVAEKLLEKATVVRVPRIHMYTKYSLIPSPDGSFYDLGFGQLVGPLSDSVDTTLNQLMDAGTLSNTQGGFALDGVNVGNQRGDIKWERGVFKKIKVPTGKSIQDALFQIRFPEPSIVLFNLLGTLIQSAKDVTSVQDIMSGAAAQGKGEAATTSMIRIEQGMKVFNAIYKRIYRSLKSEFRKLYKLNSIFLEREQYFRVLDDQRQERVALYDYQGDGTDVQPVADPQLATNLMALAKAQALMQTEAHPLSNSEEILRRFYEAMDVPSPENLIIPAEQRKAPPDPEMVLKTQKEASEHMKRVAEVAHLYADAMLRLAKAESEEEGTQLRQYMTFLRGMNEQFRTIPVENTPDNTGGLPQDGGNQNLQFGGGGQLPELPGNGNESSLPEGGL